MADHDPVKWTDDQFDAVLGAVLRTGVILSAIIVAIGGAIYLASHGVGVPQYSTFQGARVDLRSVRGIVAAARSLDGLGLIQFGVLVLIATPIARVTFSVAGFARQRDWLYVGITLVVMATLLYGLTTG